MKLSFCISGRKLFKYEYIKILSGTSYYILQFESSLSNFLRMLKTASSEIFTSGLL